MELTKRDWHCRYMREYLAVGEAPHQVRNCFQQKSRWCKASALPGMHLVLTTLGSSWRAQCFAACV